MTHEEALAEADALMERPWSFEDWTLVLLCMRQAEGDVWTPEQVEQVSGTVAATIREMTAADRAGLVSVTLHKLHTGKEPLCA